MSDDSDGASFDPSILRALGVLFKEAGEEPLRAVALCEIGLAGGEMPLKELSCALRLAPAQASRLLNGLEDDGMTIRAVGDDRRTVLVCLDARGWDFLERLSAACGGEEGLEKEVVRARSLGKLLSDARSRHRLTMLQAICLLALEALGLEASAPSAPSLVSRACGIPRTSAYCAIRALREKGAVGTDAT